eukprot:74604_1
MTHIEELQLIQEFSQNLKGDETTKLEKEIIAMELSLGILKKAKNDDINKYKKKKAEKGYIWRSGRNLKSEKNYAEKILKSHKRNLKKKRQKKVINKSKTQCKSSSTSSASTVSHSIAIQSDLNTQQKQQNMINNFFNATNDQKDDESCDVVEQIKVKRCCYHCLSLFILDTRSVEENGKYFCNHDCLSNYIKSTMVCCSDENCNVEFVRENGYRFEGEWFCRIHFEKRCVNSAPITEL